jgi:hypothetical protein
MFLVKEDIQACLPMWSTKMVISYTSQHRDDKVQVISDIEFIFVVTTGA